MASPDIEDSETAPRRPVAVGLVVIYCKGLAMGAADAVPGVSGGTIALITGIYERLIHAVTALDPKVLLMVPSLYRRERRLEFRDALFDMDVPFLLALGTGMVTAVVILARVVQFALSTVPGPTFAFFFGLIGASAIVLFDREWFDRPGPVIAAIAGFVIAVLVTGETATDAVPHHLPVVFAAGTVGISGMVLPGISGAFILLLLGQYDYMTSTLNEFVDQALVVATGGNPAAFLDATTVVVVFMAGALVGLFTVAYAVRAALERYRTATFAFLVSLMVGALRYPAIQVRETTTLATTDIIGTIVALGFGLGLVLILDYYTDDLEYDDREATE